MDASENKSSCHRAGEYYHDLLQRDPLVPPAIRRHVEGCPFCQEQMRRLGGALLEADDGPPPGSPGADEQTVAALSLHFELLGERIGCGQVKPLLPALAGQQPPVKVPTPVTVHVDQCPRCAQDLEAIGALHLRAAQLARLGRLYAACSGADPADCRRARSAIAALASLTLESVAAQVLDHVSTCSRCRAEVYRRRERLLDAAAQEGSSPAATSCPGLPAAELFDYVVPYGSAAPDERDEAKAVPAHVRACPRCLGTMQALHRTVYGIAERADSGVVTVYDLANGAESVAARHPVKVEIRWGEPEPAASDSSVSGTAEAMPRVRPAGLQRRATVKIALVAAAAILLAILWLPSSPTASGTHADEILKALENAPNIHIMEFWRHETRAIHETWVARRLGLLIMKNSRECTLYDLRRCCRTAIDPNLGPRAPVKLSEWQYQSVRAYMVGCVKSILTAVSEDTRLDPAAGDTLGGAAQTIVYEKTFERRRYGGRLSPHRWRVFIDPATSLPQRVEYFDLYPGEEQWQLTSIKVFEYPAEDDLENAIRALFPKQ